MNFEQRQVVSLKCFAKPHNMPIQIAHYEHKMTGMQHSPAAIK